MSHGRYIHLFSEIASHRVFVGFFKEPEGLRITAFERIFKRGHCVLQGFSGSRHISSLSSVAGFSFWEELKDSRGSRCGLKRPQKHIRLSDILLVRDYSALALANVEGILFHSRTILGRKYSDTVVSLRCILPLQEIVNQSNTRSLEEVECPANVNHRIGQWPEGIRYLSMGGTLGKRMAPIS